MSDLTRAQKTPLCSPEQEARLLDAIRQGNYRETACRLVGVSYTSFQQWIALGDAQETGLHREFYDLVHLAEAEAEMEVVKLLRDAGKTDWRAAASFAARRFRERWSEQAPHKEGASGVVISVGIALNTPGVALPADTWTAVPRLPVPGK